MWLFPVLLAIYAAGLMCANAIKRALALSTIRFESWARSIGDVGYGVAQDQIMIAMPQEFKKNGMMICLRHEVG